METSAFVQPSMVSVSGKVTHATSDSYPTKVPRADCLKTGRISPHHPFHTRRPITGMTKAAQKPTPPAVDIGLVMGCGLRIADCGLRNVPF